MITGKCRYRRYLDVLARFTACRGAEMGPRSIARWGKATVDRADAFGFTWERSGQSSKHTSFDRMGP